MTEPLIPFDLPPGWREVGGWEYTLYADGSETAATWDCNADGEIELTGVKVSPPAPPLPPGFQFCHVYWGSHGCHKQRGHEDDCECDCCHCGEHHPFPDWPDESVLCVAKAPYYGPETRFYGEDVVARGLPLNGGA